MPSTPSSSPDPKSRRRWVVAALGLAITAIVVAFLLSSPDDPSDPVALSECGVAVAAAVERVEVGDQVPDFTLPSLEGGCTQLSDFRGQPLILNFWASWCNPCRREFPLIADARERYDDDELEVLGITHDDIVSDSRQFADEQDAAWPLLVDEESAVADVFGVGQLPQTFFVDATGRVRAHLFGFTSKRELERQIRRALEQ